MAIGLFYGLDRSDVEEIRDAAVAMIKAGKTVMEWTSAGQGFVKRFAMPPGEMLAEAQAALDRLDGKRVRHTYARFL